MRYSELLNQISEQSACGVETVEHVLDGFFSVVLSAVLSDEEEIALRADVGRLKVSDSGGKTTGTYQEQMTKLQRTIVFRAAPETKKKLRQSDADYIAMLRKNGKHELADRLERGQGAEDSSLS